VKRKLAEGKDERDVLEFYRALKAKYGDEVTAKVTRGFLRQWLEYHRRPGRAREPRPPSHAGRTVGADHQCPKCGGTWKGCVRPRGWWGDQLALGGERE
jgi:hypothetical protein